MVNRIIISHGLINSERKAKLKTPTPTKLQIIPPTKLRFSIFVISAK